MTPQICIVGAGPAGLSAALYAIQNGADVTIVDKHIQPGKKSCGGGITHHGIPLLEKQLDVNDVVLFKKLDVYSTSSMKTLTTAHSYMAVVERSGWINNFVQHLSKSGVKLKLGVRVTNVEGTTLTLNSNEIVSADYIIGADGPKSVVRQSLKLPSSVGLVCRQLVLPKHFLHSKEMFVSPSVWFDYELFGAGYGWIFPGKSTIKIGCGVPTATHRNSDLKASFFKWLDKLNICSEWGKLEGGSIGCNYSGHRFGNVFLAGDAAGLASPLTGEGIHQALISGKEVVKEILNCSYTSTTITELSYMHTRIFNTLLNPSVGKFLYSNVNHLLDNSQIKRYVIKRFL